MTTTAAADPGTRDGAPTPLIDRLRAVAGRRGPLCLGVAPSTRWLTRWALPDTLDGARRYCEHTLAAADLVAVVKLQVPFFTRFGPAGTDLMRWYADAAHDGGALVLVDAKVGDADDTMDSYAQLYLGPDSVLRGDAVTAHPFLGVGSLEPLFTAAGRVGAAVLVLVRTSNHAAGGVQGGAGTTLSQRLADELTAWSETTGLGAATPAGALVGARPPEIDDLLARLTYGIVELPGLGRPDRPAEEVVTPALRCADRALFPVTTGILRHGPQARDLREAVRGWRTAVTRLLR